MRAASALGQYVSLSAQDAFDVEYWPLELYKLTLAPPEKELARRIALVTGGASGHRPRGGPAARRRGRARGGDRSRRGGRAAGGRGDRRQTRSAGPGARPRDGRHLRGLGARPRSRRRCSRTAASTSWSPTRASRTPRRSTAWRSPTGSARFAVNSTGHFLVAREAMRVLKAQGLGGALRLRRHQERDVAGQGLRRVLARPRPPRPSSPRCWRSKAGRTASGRTS